MTRSERLYLILCGIFITALLTAEMTGGKLIEFRLSSGWTFIMTMGVIPFPVTFLITDIINEYYGKKGIRFITFIGMAMVLMAFVILFIDMSIPASSVSPVTDEMFNGVFGLSARIIAGSLTAYLIGQLIDIYVFFWIRQKTKDKLLWLRATGSTVISQLIDSFVVLFIAFYGQLTAEQILNIGMTNYLYKFFIALALTPLIYLAHFAIDKYLGEEAKTMIHRAETA